VQFRHQTTWRMDYSSLHLFILSHHLWWLFHTHIHALPGKRVATITCSIYYSCNGNGNGNQHKMKEQFYIGQGNRWFKYKKVQVLRPTRGMSPRTGSLWMMGLGAVREAHHWGGGQGGQGRAGKRASSCEQPVAGLPLSPYYPHFFDPDRDKRSVSDVQTFQVV
jgi:hypothetical protein